MLKQMCTDMDYRTHIKFDVQILDKSTKKRFGSPSIRKALHKLTKLAVDPIRDIMFSLYSDTGRPGIDPAILIRSFVLMIALGYTSIPVWVEKAKSDELYQFLIVLIRFLHLHPTMTSSTESLVPPTALILSLKAATSGKTRRNERSSSRLNRNGKTLPSVM